LFLWTKNFYPEKIPKNVPEIFFYPKIIPKNVPENFFYPEIIPKNVPENFFIGKNRKKFLSEKICEKKIGPFFRLVEPFSLVATVSG